jgi:hypothetical protein
MPVTTDTTYPAGFQLEPADHLKNVKVFNYKHFCPLTKANQQPKHGSHPGPQLPQNSPVPDKSCVHNLCS